MRSTTVLTPLLLAALAGGALIAPLSLPAPVALAAAVAQPEADEKGAETETPKDEPKDPESERVDRMKKELERLRLEASLLEQQQKNRLLQSELEKQELSTASSLRQARLEADLAAMKEESARLRAESERLTAQAQLDEAKRNQEIADLKAEIERRTTEGRAKRLDREQELDDLQAEAAAARASNAILQEQLARAQAEAQLAAQTYAKELAELQGKLSLRDQSDKVASRVLNAPEYPNDPFQDGVLRISDRRISLNGPIFAGTADYVTERIDFFNNQSTEAPIFIVIDNSPGGSVMEGYRILKAMESSPSPVWVVVKSYAASMAACITTLAERSFAYPNAIILHHQMSSGMSGNLTQQREQLEDAMEWAKRLAVPVADKMGVTYDEFVEQMYKNNSDGDWAEFADQAQKLNWVQTIVHEIREEGIRDRPTSERWTLPMYWQNFQTDNQGNQYIKLPPLRPFDFYFIHNPGGDLYRW